MGNDLSRAAAVQQNGGRKIRINIDSPHAEAYQRVSLEEMASCLLRRDRDLGRYKMAINVEEFQQIFDGVLANPSELFSLFDTRGKGLVDVSEVFASAFLFAASTPRGLDAKLEKLWDLFDFNRNGSLDDVEAEIMLESVVRGQSLRGELTLRELKEWISERDDVATFLSNFTEARLIISSLELVEKSVALGVSMCRQATAQDSPPAEDVIGTVDGARAGDILRSLATVGKTECLDTGTDAATDADANAVVRMLTGTSGTASNGPMNQVDVEALEEFLRFWLAFSVVDEDGVGSVSSGDLKALLWLSGSTGGEEPPEATVQKTANEIDESQDGVIKRMEWIRYMAVLDEGRGNVGHDGGLLKVFRRYDDDRSGSITANEMILMVQDSVTEAVEKVHDSCVKPGMQTVVDTLVKDVGRDLVAVMDVTGSGMIGWTEFKKHQHLVKTRLATLREFVVSVAIQRGGTSASEEIETIPR